jgi:hypothetical protein
MHVQIGVPVVDETRQKSMKYVEGVLDQLMESDLSTQPASPK